MNCSVYCNLFFLVRICHRSWSAPSPLTLTSSPQAYLISPNTAHRFVGYLEEEAVLTYTQIVDEMERGNIPEVRRVPSAGQGFQLTTWFNQWEKGGQSVPQIAKDYWRLGEDATMLDLIKAVRADEAGHRCVGL